MNCNILKEILKWIYRIVIILIYIKIVSGSLKSVVSKFCIFNFRNVLKYILYNRFCFIFWYGCIYLDVLNLVW